MSMILEKIKKEILSWPNVTAEQHKFGGVEFRLNKREMGHIHGDRLADLPKSPNKQEEKVEEGGFSFR